jgi:hypothetical protein
VFERVGENFDKEVEAYTEAVEKNSEEGAKRYEERKAALDGLASKISVPKIDTAKVGEPVGRPVGRPVGFFLFIDRYHTKKQRRFAHFRPCTLAIYTTTKGIGEV